MNGVFVLIAFVVGAGGGYWFGRRASRATPELFAAEDTADDPRFVAARGAVQERIEKRLARIMEKAKAEGRITNDGAEELFCISDSTAGNYLRLLTERGDLERKGVGRGTFYVPK